MIKIQGRMVQENDKAINGEWTIEEIANFVREGRFAMLSLSGYSFKENGLHAAASALTLFPKETIPFEEDGKIIIPTAFRRHMIYGYGEKDPDELIPIHCIVEPDDERLYITIDKVWKEEPQNQQ